MRRRFASKRTPGMSLSRYVQPRLEALEDRFLPSGNPFGPSVTATITSLKPYPTQALVLPDGKVLLGVTIGSQQFLQMQYSAPVPVWQIMGQRTQGVNAIELLRLNADGTLDPTFGNGGVDFLQPDLSDTFGNFAVAPDGSIIVAGTEISSIAGYLVPAPINWPQGWPYYGAPGYDFVYQDSGMRMLRLNADGSIDSSFQAGNVSGFRVDTMGVDGWTGGIAIQADGKVVVAGEEENFGNSTIFVARYNTDGSFDTSFNPNGAQPGVATTSITNPPVVPNPNNPPSDYGWGFAEGYGFISSVVIQCDGKIVVGGSQSANGSRTARSWPKRL